MPDAERKEQADWKVRERIKDARRVLGAVVDALPEDKPVPHRTLQGRDLLLVGLREGVEP